jgi:hypothetical protein
MANVAPIKLFTPIYGKWLVFFFYWIEMCLFSILTKISYKKYRGKDIIYCSGNGISKYLEF